MHLKYIITNKNCFAIFSDTAEHSDVAKGLHGTPVGAGFCKIESYLHATDVTDLGSTHEAVLKVSCFGESTSLDLKAREIDEIIINKRINRNY